MAMHQGKDYLMRAQTLLRQPCSYCRTTKLQALPLLGPQGVAVYSAKLRAAHCKSLPTLQAEPTRSSLPRS